MFTSVSEIKLKIKLRIFRPHQMHEMHPFAIDDPIALASVSHVGNYSPDGA